MSHVSRIHESCLTHQRVWSDVLTSHVSHINESCLTHQQVMSHVLTSHVSRINKSCLTFGKFLHLTWLIHTNMHSHSKSLTQSRRIKLGHNSLNRDMTHPHIVYLLYMWHDSFIHSHMHSHSKPPTRSKLIQLEHGWLNRDKKNSHAARKASWNKAGV